MCSAGSPESESLFATCEKTFALNGCVYIYVYTFYTVINIHVYMYTYVYIDRYR